MRSITIANGYAYLDGELLGSTPELGNTEDELDFINLIYEQGRIDGAIEALEKIKEEFAKGGLA